MENSPIITLIDDEDSNNVDNICLESDSLSIEELENAVMNEDYSNEQTKNDLLEEEKKTTNRLIPIQLHNGDILNPKFESLGELVPPPWSIFHKSNNERARKVKLSTSSSEESSESFKRQISKSSEKDEDIGKIMDEFEILGKLPMNSLDNMHMDRYKIIGHLDLNLYKMYCKLNLNICALDITIIMI